MIVRWHKDHEYFIVRLYQDLIGDWIVSQSWGNWRAGESAVSHTVTGSYQDARRLLRSLSRQQRKRGYRHVGQSEEQLGFDFT